MTRKKDRSDLWQQIEGVRAHVQVLIDATPDGLFFKDTANRFILANRPVARVMGAKDPNELVGKTDHDFYPKDVADEYLADEQRLLATGGTMTDKVEPKTVDGEPRWILVSKGAVLDEKGEAVGIVGVSRDITDRKRAEDALERANRELYAISRCSQILIRAENEESLLEEVCKVICDSTGYRMAWVGYSENDEEKSVRPVASAGIVDGYLESANITWSDSERGKEPAGTAIRTGTMTAVEDITSDENFSPWRDAALRQGYRSCIAFPLRDSDSATFGALAIYAEETGVFALDEVRLLEELSNDLAYGIVSLRTRMAHRETVQALRNERTLLRTLIEILPNGVYTKDAECRKTMANPIDLRVLGTEVESEVLGKTDFDFYPREIAEKFYADDRTVIEEGRSVLGREEYYLDHDGHKRWLLTSKVPLRDASGGIVGLVGVNFDITERRAQMAKLTEQAQLLDIASDAISVRDLSNRILYWNKGAEQLYGWTADEAIGADADELLHGANRRETADPFRSVTESGSWSGELHYSCKDGREVIGETRWTLVRDELQNPRSILCVSTDITEQRTIEKQLFRAQRLESLGTLAGGVAHDLNNVLTPILMGLDLLRPHIDDEKALESLTIIHSSAERGAAVVRQLLGFARGFEGEQEEVYPRAVLDDVVRIARETFPKSIDVDLSPMPDDLRSVIGSPTQLHQVVLNLFLNARDAMEYGGKITVGARNVQLDESYLKIHVDARPIVYVLIEVADTGRGMPAEVMEKVFDPFFTTKERGKGTGLGLSTTLAIVKGHGGFITVYSETGRGSVFRVYLPAATGKPAMEMIGRHSEIAVGNGELILVVDDEEYVRRTTEQVLMKAGYRVVGAEDGTEAVALYVERRDEVRCVIVDMMMPQMDGATVIRTLRRLDPEVKIIATSGLPSNGAGGGAKELDVEAFLEKPYAVDKLLSTVQSILENENGGAS